MNPLEEKIILDHIRNQKWFKDAMAKEKAERDLRTKKANRHAQIVESMPGKDMWAKQEAAWEQVEKEFSEENKEEVPEEVPEEEEV
jgi:ABC-type protease/lipase transport system fused ATPase/permease subunit